MVTLCARAWPVGVSPSCRTFHRTTLPRRPITQTRQRKLGSKVAGPLKALLRVPEPTPQLHSESTQLVRRPLAQPADPSTLLAPETCGQPVRSRCVRTGRVFTTRCRSSERPDQIGR